MRDLLRPRTAVTWLPWTRAAFDRAREEEKIVFLSVDAAWSKACRDMDDRCYADPAVAEEINRWFIPVRVDADRRPDVAERYDLGGLPTTAFLTPEGDVLGGGTFVPKERLLGALTRVRAAGSTTARSAPPPAPTARRSTEALIAQVFDSFDREHAGFGGAPKFPLTGPVRLALDLFRETGSAVMADYATRTMDAIGWGALYDEVDGGFFRCCASVDWQEPAREKLLSTNAALLDLFLEAGVTLRNERWLARAADVLEYVQSRLSDAPGEGWRMSEASDGARFSDVNAHMVSSALRASTVFEDVSLRQLALQSAETVLLASYRPGDGVAHCRGGVRGLVSDQIASAGAQLDAWDVTEDVPHQMMAQELVHCAIRTGWDPEQGGFFDRGPEADAELALRENRLKPFVLNCEAAEVLHRLSQAVADDEFHRLAVSALDAVGPFAELHGPLAAHYLLARRSLSR